MKMICNAAREHASLKETIRIHRAQRIFDRHLWPSLFYRNSITVKLRYPRLNKITKNNFVQFSGQFNSQSGIKISINVKHADWEAYLSLLIEPRQ